jgi:small conductance mechanosensitive channel
MTELNESIQTAIDQVVATLATYGLSVVAAIVILIVGLIVSRWIKKTVHKGLGRIDNFDETLRRFFASAAQYLVITVTALAVLSEFGIETTSLIAVLGAAGLAVGLAMQGTLSSVAAGVMLLAFRPFRVGDYVEVAGYAGTVDSISLFMTDLNTPDNVHITLPNAEVWGAAVKNYSYNPTRRVDVVLGIDYGDDIDKAIAAVRDVIAKDSRIHKDPEPFVAVSELADSSVNLVIRVWSAKEDYWGIKFDLTKAFKERMDAEKISIPFPQRTVHMVSETG